MKTAGIILIIIGALALAYQGISYTRKEKVLDLGLIEATTTKKETIPLPPIIGGAILIVGVVLLVSGSRRGSGA